MADTDNNAAAAPTQEPEVKTISIEEYNSVKAEAEKYRAKLGEFEKQLEAIKNQPATTVKLDKKQDKKVDPEDERISSMQAQLNELQAQLSENKTKLKTKTLKEVFIPRISKTFIDSAQDWVMREILEETDIDGDNLDTPRIIIKGPDGSPRWSKQKQNEHMGVDEYIEEIKQRRKDFIATNMRSGEGASRNTTTSSAFNGSILSANELNNMTKDELREYTLKHGTKALTASLKQMR